MFVKRQDAASPGRERLDRQRVAGRTASAAAGALLCLAASIGIAQDNAPDQSGAAHASPAEVEVLRKLLGLTAAPTADPPSPAQVEAVPPAAESAPVVQLAPEKIEPAAPGSRSKKAPATRSQPKAVSLPKPKGATKPTLKPSPNRPQEENRTPEPALEEAGTPAAPNLGSEQDVPAPGTVVSFANMERWKHLLGPSIQWSIERGATLDVIASAPVPFEPARAEATQRYHAQVKLVPDKRSIQNYVAGIPFPFVTEQDPDAAVKMMFNMESRVVFDDLDLRNFTCETGSLEKSSGFHLQRHYLIEHFRRLFYVSRFYKEPKPTWPTAEGVRYREMLYPLREPFDLKGAGFTYIRHLDPNRQDDSWLYFPQLKRVRRLSTAQRSEGIFGQDVDLDSYGGFAGNPAWTNWSLLGKKTILASVHGAKASPAELQRGSANFFPDALWEPREVYVILGVSQFGGYNFGRRVIYLDAESFIVPYTEMYDLNGQLWRSLVHSWNQARKPTPTAKRAVYEYEPLFIPVFSLIDMQLEHSTMCRFPGPDVPGEEGWYYNFGTAEGVTEEVFSVQNMIGTGR